MTLAAKQAVIPTKKQDKPIAEGSEVNPQNQLQEKNAVASRNKFRGLLFFQNLYLSSLNYDFNIAL